LKRSPLLIVDGGISILLWCPGFKLPGGSGAEKIMVDAYISPRELKEGGKDLTKHVTLLVQAFGADIALPHLCRFEARCAVERVKPPSAPGMDHALLLTSTMVIYPP
jgi:hypothetical protein